MRRRRKARRNLENQNVCENSNETIDANINLPCKCSEIEEKQKDLSLPEAAKWKDPYIKSIIKCESDFFCEVIRRLSKEIHCARGMDDLEDIISLAAKFLQASAEKEKAIACRITAAKDGYSVGKKNANCICDLDDNEEV